MRGELAGLGDRELFIGGTNTSEEANFIRQSAIISEMMLLEYLLSHFLFSAPSDLR